MIVPFTNYPRRLDNLKKAIQSRDERYLSTVDIVIQQGSGKVGIFKNHLPIAIFESRRDWIAWKHEAYMEVKE